MRDHDITILHVEDEPVMARLVRATFTKLGFRGTLLTADTLHGALELLAGRGREHKAVDLIVSDLHLPDGTGLDLVRQVRESSHWHLTPVVVLSGETRERSISDAYALGANCYLPKLSGTTMAALRALYHCWVENALLPGACADRGHAVLSRSISLRSRTSEIYRRLAEMEGEKEAGGRFWLERSLSEGNFSNLLALFRNRVTEGDIPGEMIDRLSDMQDRVENSLNVAEKRLEEVSQAGAEDICGLVLDLADAVDEEVLVEGLGWLFPKNPAATLTFMERAADQLDALGAHILLRMEKPGLRKRAGTLRRRAYSLRERALSLQEHLNGTAASHPVEQDVPRQA